MVDFFRKHKLFCAVISLILVGALWYLFRPEKLFINQRVNEAAPFAADRDAQPIYTGRLSGKLHDTSGRATVYRQLDGTFTLRLTDFHTSNGPDVHLSLLQPTTRPYRTQRQGRL